MKKLTLLTVLLLVLSISCEKEEEINTNRKVPFTFGLTSLKKSMTLKADTQNLSFSNGYMLINELEIEAESEKDRDSLNVDVEIENTLRADLGDFDTPDTNFVIPTGEYKEIEIEAEVLDTEKRPSIFIEGSFTNSQGKEIPIKFDYRDDMEFEIERETEDTTSIVINDSNNPVAMITFDANNWFSNVTTSKLEQAQLDSTGTLCISEEVNSDIYETIVNSLDEYSEIEFEN